MKFKYNIFIILTILCFAVQAQSIRNLSFDHNYVKDELNKRFELNYLSNLPGEPVTEVTIKDYDKVLAEEKFVLVDFGAKWCGPCRKMEPSIEKISKDKELGLKVLKVDVDASEDLAQFLKIEVLPTLHLYKNKKLIWQGEGYMSESDLRSIVTKYSK